MYKVQFKTIVGKISSIEISLDKVICCHWDLNPSPLSEAFPSLQVLAFIQTITFPKFIVYDR